MQTPGRERSPSANPRERSDSPYRLVPAFLPPRPQQVEGPRREAVFSRPYPHAQCQAPPGGGATIQSGIADPSTQPRACRGAPSSLGCSLSLEVPAVLPLSMQAPQAIWAQYCQGLQDQPNPHRGPPPHLHSTPCVAPEPTQPREGVADSSSWLDVPGIHASSCLPAGYGQDPTCSTLSSFF